VFHHRLLALFYRAWAQAQPTVQHDRPQDDRYAAWLGASCGAHGTSDTPRALPESARLFQAGLLGSRSRHAEGLGKLLANHFGVPVRIEQHVAQWLALDRRDRTQLGFARNRRERAAGRAGELGVGAGCGSRLRDRQYKFRIALGPLTLAQYEAFLPGGVAWPGLCEWVNDYAGPDLRWDVRLTLARDHVPPPRLGASLRLGVATWIGRIPHPRERSDLRLRPHTSFLLQHHGGRHA
jgi:type VI secretion system protein ImpH